MQHGGRPLQFPRLAGPHRRAMARRAGAIHTPISPMRRGQSRNPRGTLMGKDSDRVLPIGNNLSRRRRCLRCSPSLSHLPFGIPGPFTGRNRGALCAPQGKGILLSGRTLPQRIVRSLGGRRPALAKGHFEPVRPGRLLEGQANQQHRMTGAKVSSASIRAIGLLCRYSLLAQATMQAKGLDVGLPSGGPRHARQGSTRSGGLPAREELVAMPHGEALVLECAPTREGRRPGCIPGVCVPRPGAIAARQRRQGSLTTEPKPSRASSPPRPDEQNPSAMNGRLAFPREGSPSGRRVRERLSEHRVLPVVDRGRQRAWRHNSTWFGMIRIARQTRGSDRCMLTHGSAPSNPLAASI
jgi:hypothetical protein